MMSSNPKVSVIMPVYNAKEYVEGTIKSVLSQTFRDFELIIIDDGSFDGSAEICEYFSIEDSRVRLRRQENHGICVSRNTAIDMANGQYVAFCDHDDIYEPDYLKLLVEAADDNNADLVKGQYKGIIETNGKETANSIMDYLDGECSLERLLRNYKYFLRTINVLWNGLYVRKIIVECNIRFDESFKAGWEDNIFNLHYLKNCKKIFGVNKLIYSHIRRSGQSASLGYNSRRTDDLMKVYQEEACFLEKKKSIVSGRTFIEHQNRFLTAFKTELWYADCPLTKEEKIRKITMFMKNRKDFRKTELKDFVTVLKENPRATIKWLLFHWKMPCLLCLYWDVKGN